MAHFAKIENNLVVDVIVADQEFIDSLPNKGSWVQTSYNTHGGKHPDNKPLRKNYAGIGFTYDPVRDAFIPPRNYPSWTLNEQTCLWDAPVPFPSDIGTPENPKVFVWSEEELNWIQLNL